MSDIPDSYFSDLSCFEELAVKAGVLGYDVESPAFWRKLANKLGYFGYVFASGRVVFVTSRGKVRVPKIYKGVLDLSRKGLVSLEGLPSSSVIGTLDVDFNALESLEGCTRTVAGSFFCCNNWLKTLKGGPATVTVDYFCRNNRLTSLEGCPQRVGRTFCCNANYLTSLEGGPAEVVNVLSCARNPLKTLKGAPSKVGGNVILKHTDLSRKQIDDYFAFLNHPSPDLMDETGHYRPKEEV